QRPRDRRRGQRQDVHRLLDRLDRLLVADAEALLLVDDEEPQVAEAHVPRKQAVGADQNVEAPLRRRLESRLLLLRRSEARQHLDPRRPRGEALAEGVQVLEGEDRRRAEDGYLL